MNPAFPKRIAKSDIKELLRQSASEWNIYAPLENEWGDTLFGVLPKKKAMLSKAIDSVNLKDVWTVISPKDIFFPQLETMFMFDKGKIEEETESSKKLIFGIKPCDLKGMLFADEFFRRNIKDIYYLSRAGKRLVVTIGCIRPPRPQACFCVSAKTGPFAEGGYDLQLVDIGDSYLVEIGSLKGKDFVDAYRKLFKNAEKDTEKKIKGIKTKAAKSINVKVDFEKALEIMNPALPISDRGREKRKGGVKGDKVFEENYRRIGERCIYCGACLYACPTCTCFNVFDDKKNNDATRKRNWDACVFEGYTREASGHNPRNKKWLRTARRYEHKLKYDYKATGMSGCIACGRCLASCPVEIGISKFIEEITTKKPVM